MYERQGRGPGPLARGAAAHRRDAPDAWLQYAEITRHWPFIRREEPGASPWPDDVVRRRARTTIRAQREEANPPPDQTAMERRLGLDDPDVDVLAPRQWSGEEYEHALTAGTIPGPWGTAPRPGAAVSRAGVDPFATRQWSGGEYEQAIADGSIDAPSGNG